MLKALWNSWIGVRLGTFPVVPRSLFSRRCNFSRWAPAANSQAGQAHVITDQMSALSRVDLMLALNRALLSGEY